MSEAKIAAPRKKANQGGSTALGKPLHKTDEETVFDFRTKGPMPWICEICNKAYKGWEVSSEDWQLVPTKFLDLMLCEEDYLRLVKEAGHDPGKVKITHKTHKWQLKGWRVTKDCPANHTKIGFEHDVEGPVTGESMWCEVLKDLGEGELAVRLLNDSVVSGRIRDGSLWAARWEGAFHRTSGRPVLKPVRRLRRVPSGKKKGGATKAAG
jgi:hypothetical protein